MMNNRVFIVFIVSLLFGVFGCTYSKRNVPFTQAPAPQMIHNVDVKMKHEIVKDLDTESCGKFFWLFPTPLAFTFGDFGISHPFADTMSLADESAINKSIDENTDAVFVQRKTYDTFKVLPFYSEDCVKIKGKAVKVEFE